MKIKSKASRTLNLNRTYECCALFLSIPFNEIQKPKKAFAKKRRTYKINLPSVRFFLFPALSFYIVLKLLLR